jgi:hypothetical protein
MSTSQSIRSIAVQMFADRLPTRATVGDKAFRKGIILDLAEQTGCTIAAASTHYNHAFQGAKVAVPALVIGLGRPEGKNNGGRKRKVIPVPVQAPAPLLLLTYTPTVPKPVVDLSVLLQPLQTPLLPTPQVEEQEQPAAVEETVRLYSVQRAKDGAVVAEGLTQEAADAMVAKAAAGKKAKLVVV